MDTLSNRRPRAGGLEQRTRSLSHLGETPWGLTQTMGFLGGMFFRLTLCMFSREQNRPPLHFARPGCPGGQFPHRWCGCRHLPVHRWTAVLITLQPPLEKGWTDGCLAREDLSSLKTQTDSQSGTLCPKRFGVTALFFSQICPPRVSGQEKGEV